MSAYNLHHGKSPLEVSIVTGAGAEVREYLANGTIVAGDVVALDWAGKTGEDQANYVIQGAANAGAIGVALEAAVAGGVVRVCVAGYIEGVKSGTVSAGDSLVAGASGAVAAYASAATDAVLGVALDADGSSAVTMYWFRKA